MCHESEPDPGIELRCALNCGLGALTSLLPQIYYYLTDYNFDPSGFPRFLYRHFRVIHIRTILLWSPMQLAEPDQTSPHPSYAVDGILQREKGGVKAEPPSNICSDRVFRSFSAEEVNR